MKKQSVFLANKNVLARQSNIYIVEFRKEKDNDHWFWQGVSSGKFLNGFLHRYWTQIFGNDQFIQLHFEEGKQKCLLQLPFFILQGD